MQIPVLIESSPEGGFQARGGEPFSVTASGPTPQAALSEFRNWVAAKLRDGAQLTAVDVEPVQHPWLPFSGMFEGNDPIVAQWLEEIQSSRQHTEDPA